MPNDPYKDTYREKGKIQLHHPEEGVEGMMMDEAIYNNIREAILNVVKREGKVPFAEMTEKVQGHISQYEESAGEDIPAVTLDLEGHGILVRVEESKPYSVKLAENKPA